MDNWLLKNLYEAFLGLMIFLLGFGIGTTVDVGFFSLYRQWDPKERNNTKLVALAAVQLFIIIFIINVTTPVKFLGTSFAFGLMSSQVFLFVHAVESISNKVFDRDCSDD